jgi:hypothetical protein
MQFRVDVAARPRRKQTEVNVFDWRHALILGAFVVWYQLRRTAAAMDTKVGEEVKQAFLAWIHGK